MKIAIINDWLIQYTGTERVFEEVYSCFPEADVFALIDFLPPKFRGFLNGKKSQTSFLQKIPFVKKNYRNLLFLMPWAVERLDLSQYDLIISLPHAVAKGVKTHTDQLHIAYMQARNLKYIYEDREFYRSNALKDFLVDRILPSIRKWDALASKRPDITIANSHYVREWHRNRHQIDSEVIYPPVDISHFSEGYCDQKEEYYVTVGRLEPYKRTEIIVQSFNSIGAPLKIIGDGTQFKELKKQANSNIQFLGYLSKGEISKVLQKARGFIFASCEDFGIAPLEAQACGTPVIAYGKGGALETVEGMGSDKPTGVFFNRQDVESIKGAVALFETEAEKVLPENCRENAIRFNSDRFRKEFKNFVELKWSEFLANKRNVIN